MTPYFETKLGRLYNGDCLDVLDSLPKNSISLVLTDPPYFLDKLDNKWDYDKVSNVANQSVIKSMPSGMKFNRSQGIELYKWYMDVSTILFDILRPGGFFFSFSSPRLYHRMASAMDDAGFEIRDMFVWLYTQSQVKAMSLNHFIEKMSIPQDKKDEIKQKLSGWKTPQIKSCLEPIAMGQKPTAGTYLNNILNNEIGLFNVNIKIGDNMYPSNVMSIDNINETIDKFFLIGKPTKQEKGKHNDHKTVKPILICEYLISLAAFSKSTIVLDPFMGSGTTAIACEKLGVKWIGIEKEEKHCQIAASRIYKAERARMIYG